MTESDDMSVQLKRGIQGNAEADDLATTARKSQFDLEAAHDIDEELSRQRVVCKTIAVVGALWPRTNERFGRKPTVKADRATRLQLVHQWVCSHGLWRCTTCAKYSWGNEQQGPVCDTACDGPKELKQGPRMAELGHVILVGRLEGVPVRFCARCGARASWKSVLLARKCRGHPASQATESLLRRLRAGVDPRTKKPLIDVLPLNAFLRKLAEPVKVEVKGPEQKSEADNMDVETTGSEVEVVPWQPLRASGDTLVAAPGRWWEHVDPPSRRHRAGRRYAKKELWKGTGVSDGAMRVVRLAPLTRKGGKAGGRRQPLGEQQGTAAAGRRMQGHEAEGDPELRDDQQEAAGERPATGRYAGRRGRGGDRPQFRDCPKPAGGANLKRRRGKQWPGVRGPQPSGGEARR